MNVADEMLVLMRYLSAGMKDETQSDSMTLSQRSAANMLEFLVKDVVQAVYFGGENPPIMNSALAEIYELMRCYLRKASCEVMQQCSANMLKSLVYDAVEVVYFGGKSPVFSDNAVVEIFEAMQLYLLED